MKLSDLVDWRLFPDPTTGEWLSAPYGAGVYELRLGSEQVKVGKAKNVAYRMSSLVPETWGSGSRKNAELREFVWQHLQDIEYRCYACASEEEAVELERGMLNDGGIGFHNRRLLVGRV